MRTFCLALALAALAQSADFHNGQAARAVIGQSSFSARETGVTAYALSLTHGKLHAAEATRLLTFDVSRSCVLCGFAPVSVTNQSVMRGVSAVASLGKVVVIADTANHHVLIWRSSASKQPDLALTVADPVSVAYDGHRLFVGDAGQHKVLVWNALPNSEDQAADAVLGQVDGGVGAATIGTPSALVSDGANLFVSDTENHRILVFSPGDIGLPEDAIFNSASLLSTALAPGTLITVRAAGVAIDAEAAEPSESAALPTKLAGVEVYLNGVPLSLLSVTSEEIQAQLPYDLGNATSGSLYVRSVRDNGAVLTSSAAAIHFAPASPGIFAIGTQELRNGLLLHLGDKQEANEGPSRGVPITGENPALAGEVVTVWASGLGLVGTGDARATDGDTVLPVHALVNGEPAEVLSARLPRGATGIYEVVIALPPGLRTADEVRLQLLQNSVVSNTVIFPVQETH